MSLTQVLHHQALLQDSIRMTAYHRAISEVVRPGDIVIDIGTGSGILSFLAAKAGARRVYAIEHGDIINAARKLAEVNGLGSQIVFVHSHSAAAEIPETADVVLSEILGHFGIEEDALAVSGCAREKWLRPGGTMLPAWLAINLVPVACPSVWEAIIGFWQRGLHGVDFSALARLAHQTPHLHDCTSAVGVAPPQTVARYDFASVENPPAVLDYSAEFMVCRSGTLHGLVGYFEAGLSPGVNISTGPHAPLTHWKQMFFPGEVPVPVEPGDRIMCRLKRGQGGVRFWFWSVVVTRGTKRLGQTIQFAPAMEISPRMVQVTESGYVPRLSQAGEARRRLFELSDGRRTLGEISALLYAEYPTLFSDMADARLQAASWLWRLLAKTP
jgi:protein arginine N-methyltransferase 1